MLRLDCRRFVWRCRLFEVLRGISRIDERISKREVQARARIPPNSMRASTQEAFSDVKSLLQFFTLYWTTHPAIFPTSFVSRVLVDDEGGQIMRSPFSATTQIRSLKTTQAILKSLRDDDMKEILSQTSSCK